MEQRQKPVVSQEQKLRMNPQLYQSIQLMTLPIQELRFRIQEELERNPALEVIEEHTDASIEEISDRENNEEYDYFENTSDPGYTISYDEESSDNKKRFIEGALSRPESLQEHLLWQLRLQPIPERWFETGELLIRNLDENGFHREPPELLVKPEERPIVEKVTKIIQSFDPIGVCTRDYKESLIVQAGKSPDSPPAAVEILKNHLPLLEKGKHDEIAKKMKKTKEEVEKAVEFIKTLNPFPGRLYSNELPRYVIPDLIVTIKEGNFVIILNDEEIPVLGINSFFKNVLQAKNKAPNIKNFVKTNIKNANWFIRSIKRRNETLLRISKAIVEFQKDFFLKGPKYLRPLTLKDIADEVGVHETTVSRISNSKYVQTEWGIFELKYFFSNSISGAGSGGSRFSKEAVKQIIKEIIKENSEGKRLSDQKITEALENRGIKLARRTVAKYRKELDIASSYER